MIAVFAKSTCVFMVLPGMKAFDVFYDNRFAILPLVLSCADLSMCS